ncbi:MAG: hypothetical protein V4663_15370 [Bacteroidota bacterium]
MIKKLLLIAFICCSCGITMYAQQSPNALALTNVLPPSPNASEQTKYSGVPINYATGSANVQIPMGEIRSGKIVVPISVNYSGGNGIKINQIASRTGMNWALNAGGLISRTVYHQPDETSKWLTPPAGLDGDSPPVYFYLDSATQVTIAYDTQSDIFNFEFNGYSGKFILKPTERTKVIQLSPSPLRIETNFNGEFVGNWSIMITDPKGFVYLFGGTAATEMSKTVPDGTGCGKSYAQPIATAWYLTKISRYTGEYVNFNYSALTFDYVVDGSQTLIRTPQSTIISPKCTTANCTARSDSPVCKTTLQSQGVLLSSITSNLNQVSFNYVARTDLPNDRLLSLVQFSKRNTADTTQSVIYNNFSFEYVYSNNTSYYNAFGGGVSLSSRAFLKTITRSVAGQAAQYHRLNYLNINALASRLSFAQDYWGFFNGKNNVNLVPKSAEPELESLFPSNLANREPDAAYSAFGLLSSITYPTGGKDSLQYESNTVYETRRPVIPRTYFDHTIQGTGVSENVTYTYPFTLYSSQNVTFNFSTQETGGTLNGHQIGILRIRDGAGIELYNTVLHLDSSNVHTLALGAGNYTAEMNAAGQATLARLFFNYQTLGPEVTANYEAGGVRVLRNISIPNIGLTLQKRFLYAATASPAASSGKLRSAPNPTYYYSNLIDGFNCPDFSVSQCLNKVGYSNPIYPLTYFSGNHIYYTDVVELQNETLENGGTVHQYLVSNIQEPPLVRGGYIPGVPLSTINMNNGLERITKHFSYSAGTYKTVQLIRKNYISDPRLYQQFDNYVVRRNWLPTATSSPPSPQMYEPFDVSRFVISSDWVYADTVVTINYDLNGNNPVESRQLTKYNSIIHLQPTEISNNMSDGRTQRIVLKYPQEMVNAGVTVPYQAMITKNQIIAQIVREEYIGVDFKQAVNTNFQAWAAGVIEPLNIQTRMGASTAIGVIDFDAYDTMGNLLTQSQTGGIKISYKYGYWNNFPIAECRNALTTEFFSQNFEEVGGAATSTPHTGLKYHAGDYAVSWAIPNARAYKISYWYLDGTWKYAEQNYTGPLTLTAGTAIDDVNIYPKDAEIKTYTYNLLAGPSSMIDQKGQTIYYTYDAYLRLQYIKDQFGNIIKSHTYNYKP